MLRLSSLLVVMSLCVTFMTSIPSSDAALLRSQAEMLTPEEEARLSPSAQRLLQRMDREFPEDICKKGKDDYGPCDKSKFPSCPSGTQICYNRKPFKDRFFDDNRQPKYYIDYGLVFCYPDNFDACSSCTPGRYCKAESRCILDEKDYVCAEWL